MSGIGIDGAILLRNDNPSRIDKIVAFFVQIALDLIGLYGYGSLMNVKNQRLAVGGNIGIATHIPSWNPQEWGGVKGAVAHDRHQARCKQRAVGKSLIGKISKRGRGAHDAEAFGGKRCNLVDPLRSIAVYMSGCNLEFTVGSICRGGQGYGRGQDGHGA